ncbi:hypothetical protein [Arthrobacter sp. AFG7.2]|uniref:hypothetical protein n=1 Tax=Arthrobacter sp. AFG7.2 TaxID=1688693 RepID=UPI0016711D77|nr:hypothetical protein [Arthrobacter sp. AFG7.2]
MSRPKALIMPITYESISTRLRGRPRLMGGEEEEEWHGDEYLTPALRPAPMEWSVLEAIPNAFSPEPHTLLHIKFESRDYSLRQFSETILDAEAMIQFFSITAGPIAKGGLGRPLAREAVDQIREYVSEHIEVRGVSLSSPLEIVYVAATAAAIAAALNRWITVKSNWEKARAEKAKADTAVAESKVARAEANRDVKKARLEELATEFVIDFVENETKQGFHSLPDVHPLKKMTKRTINGLTELDSASAEMTRSDR